MATDLPSCFYIEFLEHLKFLVNFTLLKYVKSQRSYGFLITKELIFGFQILDLKDHFSASLNEKVTIHFSSSNTSKLSFLAQYFQSYFILKVGRFFWDTLLTEMQNV